MKNTQTRNKKLSPVRIVKGIILAVALFLLADYLIRHSHEFHFLKSLRVAYIIPVVLLNVFILFLSGYRFYLLLTNVAHRIPIYTVFKTFIFSRFVNKFVPFGGSVYRAVAFKISDGVSYKKYIASSVAFDWLNLIFSTLLGIIVIEFYDPRLKISDIPLIPVFVGAFLLLILGILLMKKGIRFFLRLFSAGWLGKRLDDAVEIADNVKSVLGNPSILWGNSIIVFLIIGSNLCSYFLLFKSVGVDMNAALLLVYLIINRIFRSMRITPANLGIREFLMGFLTYSLGAGPAEGVAVSIMARVIILLIQGGLSLGFLSVEGVRRFSSHEKDRV
ncbi:MAG: flippase-like domain-containing protein [Candidatus Aminicenantes bacterium]|nr:flippase-like domain-containing protein [Candidatus Aminicenantes bacterium]